MITIEMSVSTCLTKRMRRCSRGLSWWLCVGASLSPTLVAAQQSAWTVKPEWVRAHEEFLASDVMQGRGSATRDEEITATYIASEFMAYGLKPAPGFSGYIQSAEVVSANLDGHGTLIVGQSQFAENADFQVLVSSGAGVSGRLLLTTVANAKNVPATKGAVIVVTDVGADPFEVLQQIPNPKPAMLVVRESEETKAALITFGGKTLLPMRLKEAPKTDGGLTIVTVSAILMDQLTRSNDAIPVALQLHDLPLMTPRLTFNALGYLEGSDPQSGTILVSAHLDHLGTGIAVNGDIIFNGANDDASGTTAVLELAHALGAGSKLKRNVLFVCFGSEEQGNVGSTYFGHHPPVSLDSLVANLQFEMIGAQDPKMPKGVLLLSGWERSNLGPTLKEHGALLGADPYLAQHFFERSDNYALALRGVVAHTAAGWAMPPTYHQPSDDLAHLDLPFMTNAIQSLVEPIRWLANSDFIPQWVEGRRPK